MLHPKNNVVCSVRD